MAQKQEDTYNDGWQTENSAAYDSYKFYISYGSDSGEGVTISAKVPKSMSRAVDVLVQSGKTEYSTRSDVVRNALYHLMHKHSEEPQLMELDLSSGVAYLRLLDESNSREDLYRKFDDELHRVMEHARNLRRKGQARRSREMILRIYQDTMTISDEEIRLEFQDRIETEFDVTPSDLLDI